MVVGFSNSVWFSLIKVVVMQLTFLNLYSPHLKFPQELEREHPLLLRSIEGMTTATTMTVVVVVAGFGRALLGC